MTTTITAAEINKLRQMTGAGMMDCKKALTEAEGDFEKAIDELRKKGQKVAANRSDRDSKEGVVVAKTTADNKPLFFNNSDFSTTLSSISLFLAIFNFFALEINCLIGKST